MDVRENSSLGHGNLAEELVQLLVVADGELEMSWDDPGSFVVLGGVASQLEELGGEVLENRGHVDGGSGSEPLGVPALTEVPGDSADRELKTGSGAPGLIALGTLDFLTASFAYHLELVLC